MASNDLNNYLEETELLIQLVRDRPALYDRSRSDFKDPAHKQFVWQEVADLMGCTTQEIQKKWIGLRDRYTAEHRRLKKNPGAAPSAWPFNEAMSFLEKQIIERRRILPYLFSSLRSVGPAKDINDVKTEAFDSGVSGDSLWESNGSAEAEVEYRGEVCEAITPEVITSALASKRQHSPSPGSPVIPEKKEKTKLEDGILGTLQDIGTAAKQLAAGASGADNSDKLFGKMIGAMVADLNEEDKNRAKVHIMSYLCTQGYKL